MIITNEELLRVECSDVLPEEVDSIRNSLEKELKHSYEMGRPGIGLAAPQIGIAKNIAIVRIISDIGDKFNVDLVNAKIISSYNEIELDNEGCLSFPKLYGKTKRYNEIYVSNTIKPYKFIAVGLLSVCIQHELDHLNGILLPDRFI